jgi:hypothetical protein
MIQKTKNVGALDSNDAATAAMQDSIDRDIERHRLLGHSIWEWRDGEVHEVPAEEIEPLAQVRARRAAEDAARKA